MSSCRVLSRAMWNMQAIRYKRVCLTPGSPRKYEPHFYWMNKSPTKHIQSPNGSSVRGMSTPTSTSTSAAKNTRVLEHPKSVDIISKSPGGKKILNGTGYRNRVNSNRKNSCFARIRGQSRRRAPNSSASVSSPTLKQVETTVKESLNASRRTHTTNSRLSLSKDALVLRFSNENSYLNWARNGVLSSGVGVAMYAQEHHRGAQLSGAGLLLLGFGYIGVGTVKYIYYILRFRQAMELSWASVIGTCTHASVALIIWLTGTASFLESVPLELDAMLLTEPIASYLPFRIRQGLIETYSLYLDDLEHHSDEQERVLRAIRGEVGAEIASEAVIDRPILSNELQQTDADLQPSPSVLLPKN
uniref:Uncharacterized protein AlNc14C179G8180 n=1 Tax=Albugo laibachii Nc14 TaxID=890382 RepID=F0WEL2_9STRA|nr:conserved hypothetical protein [Albugo laibachii Nc14]CCA23076.1 conserved hypothetical protein [Albugo laibachii Nc14]|eukprot:CCA23076.1 conserved hypothetical protein [Albugo laibachii Nc14]